MTESYSYSSDFSSNINTDQLSSEIQDNVSILTNLTSISKSGDDINILFDSTISSGERTILNSIVSGHSPQGPIKIGLKTNENATYGSSIHLIAGHTSNIDLVLPNQSDTLIGNSTVDILTNKTITDSSSNIAARTLVAVDGAVLIDISAASEPSVGQVLKATSNTTAIWQAESGGGEANTASNQGAGGVGVFKQKTSLDLEFKNINAGNNTISITDDTGNDEIDIAVNVGNISRNELADTLTVTNGGTGATSLTSGNVLVGAGTSAVTTTKAAPTGDFVGTTDTQTLTNKTLTTPVISSISNTGTLTLPTSTDTLVGRATTDTLTNKTISSSTNTVGANELRTTGASVNVDSAAPPSTGQVLKATSATTATWQEDSGAKSYFHAYDAGGGVSVASGWTAIPWDTERKKDSIYTHTANSTTITVTQDGEYIIEADVTLDGDNQRKEGACRIALDTGSGFTEVAGTRRNSYHRNNSQNNNSMTTRTYLSLSNGDQIQIQANLTAGSGSLTTLANGCSIHIETA